MTTYWRIESIRGGSDSGNPGEGLMRHIRHAPLVSVLVRAGERSQAYVAGTSCSGCRDARCETGCYAHLLRRVLGLSGITMAETPLQHGLAERTYTRFVLAIPDRAAQPLAADATELWPSSRVALAWRARGARLRCGALLATDAQGPDPCAALRSRGWKAFRLPAPLGRALLARPLAIPGGNVIALEPSVMVCSAYNSARSMPAIGKDDDPADEREALFQRAGAYLAAIERPEDRQSEPVAPGPVSSADDPLWRSIAAIEWPDGPAGISGQRVARVVLSILQTPAMVEGRPSRVGLAVSRLRRSAGLTLAEARAILVWLDDAGLVAPPIEPARPWYLPRPLVSLDPSLIAASLAASAPPAEDRVQSVFPPCSQ